MPNLENMKKRAKRYLRWHRDRYYPVAARIRTLLPRYRELTDDEVLAAGFELADAQELVARAAGFETWETLRKGIQTMTADQARPLAKPFYTPPNLSCSSPISREQANSTEASSVLRRR